MNFCVSPSWPVLVLEDDEDRISWFRARLSNAAFAKTSEQAITLLSSREFRVVFLDHDLHWMDAGFPDRQHGNGKEVARYLARTGFQGIVVIHSKSEQAEVMARILPNAKVCPFGSFEISVAEEQGSNGD